MNRSKSSASSSSAVQPALASASASSSSAVQPARTAGASASSDAAQHYAGSAAQPARQLSTISAVLRWLGTLTEQTASARLKDIKAAAEVLQTPKPRQQDVGPLCKTWSVKQKDGKQKRALPEIIRDLREKVIDASSELKIGNLLILLIVEFANQLIRNELNDVV